MLLVVLAAVLCIGRVGLCCSVHLHAALTRGVQSCECVKNIYEEHWFRSSV